MLEPTSRYAQVGTAIWEPVPDGRSVRYLLRRFCPQPEPLASLGEHVVAEGDRLDNISARYLGDPEQFWRIADANRALDPGELTRVVGRRLRITLPDGVPEVTFDG
ncbi:LysM domain-containing protein [Streptomyces sp. ODS28]|uniref:LysM peptidoglycan-binding domain-containing protein n=1 Tax=Streptomyces sp. ODS28 TaxID=3136688 RepID=UPI0031EF59C9